MQIPTPIQKSDFNFLKEFFYYAKDKKIKLNIRVNNKKAEFSINVVVSDIATYNNELDIYFDNEERIEIHENKIMLSTKQGYLDILFDENTEFHIC